MGADIINSLYKLGQTLSTVGQWVVKFLNEPAINYLVGVPPGIKQLIVKLFPLINNTSVVEVIVLAFGPIIVTYTLAKWVIDIIP